MHLPRRLVNKPAVNATDSVGWHHAPPLLGGAGQRKPRCHRRAALSRFVDRSLMPGQGPTREDFKRTIAEILDATPTTTFTIEEQIVEGDTVVTKYRQSFVMRAEVIGIPPTGEEETEVGIFIHRISDGKITEEWGIIDNRPAMESLAQEIRERERIEQDLRACYELD
jgi:predicted ester cyclase